MHACVYVFICQSQKPAVKLERVSIKKKNNYSDDSVNDKVYVTLLCVCMYACVCVE